MNYIPTVSVIIPVYRVVPFVEHCVRSLMTQTLQEVEFIFVDDASPDGSMDVIRRVIAEYERDVKILVHDHNRGLPAARNTGLDFASGTYIYHCDSDDWLEREMLEKMVNCATEHNSDFVYCDFFLSYTDKERYMAQPHFSDKFDALQKGVMSGNMKHNVWNKLIKRKLYIDNGIKSPEEHCKGGEDYMIVKLLRMAEGVSHVPEALYHYNRTNVNSITNKSSERHFADIKANADDVIAFLTTNPIPNPDYLQYFKLDVKLPFLMEHTRDHFNRWKAWYPEANGFITRNPDVPFRTKMVEVFANWGFFLPVWFYAYLVDLFYRIVFHVKSKH